MSKATLIILRTILVSMPLAYSAYRQWYWLCWGLLGVALVKIIWEVEND